MEYPQWQAFIPYRTSDVIDKLKSWLQSMPVEVRDHLVQHHTGSGIQYINKRIYTAEPGEMPKFKMKIAVGLDKASRGQVDFRTMIDGGEEIDWAYVKRRLARTKHLTDAGEGE